MKLIYYRSEHGNFGDDLNLDLWPQFSPQLFEAAASGEGFSGIGTIIGMPTESVERIHVFTSGVGYNPIGQLSPRHEFWAVRGPLTAAMLGLTPETAITDGALLAPRVFPKPNGSADKMVVVPHWESLLLGGWPEACREAGFDLVDPTLPPSVVLPKLANAKLVLTESLHGAILADAYGRPWIPFSTVRSFSTFKWLDWTRTVDVRFAPTLVPPPTALAAVVLGRPRGGVWGQKVEPTPEDIAADIARLKAGLQADPPRAASAAFTAKRWLASQPSLGALMGYSPRRTGAALWRLAASEPTLSTPAVRERLTERLVERFGALCQAAGAESRL